jgi:hypothetical protein
LFGSQAVFVRAWNWIDTARGEYLNCLFVRDTTTVAGGAVWVQTECPAVPAFVNCTFWGNVSPAGVIGYYSAGGCSFVIEKTLIAFNDVDVPVACDDEASVPFIWCSDIYGNRDGDWTDCIAGQRSSNVGNFSADPLLCDAANGDYSLQASSPCAEGHQPTYDCEDYIGAFTVGCGSAVEATTWGTVKSLFK